MPDGIASMAPDYSTLAIRVNCVDDMHKSLDKTFSVLYPPPKATNVAYAIFTQRLSVCRSRLTPISVQHGQTILPPFASSQFVHFTLFFASKYVRPYSLLPPHT